MACYYTGIKVTERAVWKHAQVQQFEDKKSTPSLLTQVVQALNWLSRLSLADPQPNKIHGVLSLETLPPFGSGVLETSGITGLTAAVLAQLESRQTLATIVNVGTADLREQDLGFFPSYLARTKPALQGNSEATDEKAVLVTANWDSTIEQLDGYDCKTSGSLEVLTVPFVHSFRVLVVTRLERATKKRGSRLYRLLQLQRFVEKTTDRQCAETSIASAQFLSADRIWGWGSGLSAK